MLLATDLYKGHFGVYHPAASVTSLTVIEDSRLTVSHTLCIYQTAAMISANSIAQTVTKITLVQDVLYLQVFCTSGCQHMFAISI